MSKYIKKIMVESYRDRFNDISDALLIDIRGIDANENNTLRLDLHAKNIRITVLRNTLARDAFCGTSLENILPALDGPTALCYGGESVINVARELVDWAKKVEHLDLKGAILDGEYFDGDSGVKELSKYPTLDESKGLVIQLVLSPGSKLMSIATSPGSGIMGIVKEVEERLENSEVIEKVRN
jgi:large subunit ribosomal protein L10